MIENVDQLQLLINEDFGTEVKIVLEPVYAGAELGKYESGAWDYNLHSTKIHPKHIGILDCSIECSFSNFDRIKLENKKYYIHNIYFKYHYKDTNSNGPHGFLVTPKGYFYDTENKKWQKINKELNEFKVK